jgi:endonuclease/exonuclease/phosphatase family metal-dependent hydrolase
MKEKNADVVALQELCGYDEKKLTADAAAWGHNYVAILKTGGYPTGLTSRQPIEVKERLTEGLWHGMLHATTYGIDFFVVHLSPADCNFRLKEANIISQKVTACNNERYVILGDFNAHSPFDQELLTHNQHLLKKYAKSTSDKYSNLRLGQFDYAVISQFLALPAIDVSNKYVDIRNRFTFPTPVLLGTYAKTMEDITQNRERIDYILTSPGLATKCTSVTMFNKGEAETFSDHYPIMAEFSFETEN